MQKGWKNHEALLQTAGLDDFEGYEVEYFVFQGGNLCLEALASGQVDFTGTSEIPPIVASKAAGGGNFKVILINSSSPQTQELVALESSAIKQVTDLKGKKVEAIADYFARVQKAYQWAKNNIEEWAKIQAEPTGNTYEDRGYLYQFIGIDEQVIASEQNVADALYELEVLDEQTDVSTFYDTSFYEKYEKALNNLN